MGTTLLMHQPLCLVFEDESKLTLSDEKAVRIHQKRLDSIDPYLAPFLLDWFNDSPTIPVKTSGSTGTPKWTHLNKKAMVKSAEQTLLFFKLLPHQTALLCLPCEFIAGKMMVVRALIGELQLHLIKPSGNPLTKLHLSIDFAAFTPFQIHQILSSTPYKINHINIAIIGGGQLDIPSAEKLQEPWVTTQCYATFGMTETITHIALKKINGKNNEGYFKTLPAVKVTVSENQTLIIHAPYIQDTPIITNDVIEWINEHSFKWIGRLDFVINSGGIKLFPEVIEEKIAHLLPNHSFYIGKKEHSSLGEVPVLYIESAAPFSLPNFSSILSKFEYPKEVYFEFPFERTLTNKIIRK